ncbi:MAG: hypothetical protein AAB385_06600 [Planctomycetota bacterium]
MLEPTQRIHKADPPGIHLLPPPGLDHHRPHQVVHQHKHRHFLHHPFDGLALEHIQPHRRLQVFQIRFDVPADAVEPGQFRRRIGLRVPQRRYQGDFPRTTAGRTNPITQFPNHDRRRQSVVFVWADPARLLRRLEPLHELVLVP